MIRVLGVDPGLTRCGVGIVDVGANRTASLVFVTVIRTPIDMPLEQRLLQLGNGFEKYLQEYSPQAVALEEVFAQLNTRTVMGTAQASGVAMFAAARRGLRVGLHTPTEVKAAITGYGGANKKQVATMVQRVLRLVLRQVLRSALHVGIPAAHERRTRARIVPVVRCPQVTRALALHRAHLRRV